jgi:hypothetical protein
MSGGRFDYLQGRYEWEEAIECIKENLKLNPYDLRMETIDEFKKGLEIIQKARIYLERIDYLLSGDDGEDSFHERLKGDLKKMKNEKD